MMDGSMGRGTRATCSVSQRALHAPATPIRPPGALHGDSIEERSFYPGRNERGW